MSEPLRFDTKHGDHWTSDWCGPWEVTQRTRAFVYFYKPAFDGDERLCRRYRWRDWWQGIVDGTIRIVGAERGRKLQRVRRIASRRLAEESIPKAPKATAHATFKAAFQSKDAQ